MNKFNLNDEMMMRGRGGGVPQHSRQMRGNEHMNQQRFMRNQRQSQFIPSNPMNMNPGFLGRGNLGGNLGNMNESMGFGRNRIPMMQHNQMNMEQMR